jgi:hypothetical protein
MREQRKHTKAVIDHDRVAGEVQIAREHNAPAVRRLNGSAGRAEKVGPAVRLPRLAVEHAARTERPIRAPRHRPNETHIPETVRLGLRPELVEFGSLAHDAGNDRLWWIHECIIDLQHASAEFTGPDVEFSRRL